MKKYTIIILMFFASLLSAQVMQNEEPTPLAPNDAKFLSDQIIVQGLYIRTLGNFNEVWSSGSGVYINYGMFFPDHNTLNFQVGYINYSLRDGLDAVLDTMGITDTKFTVIPILVGGKYFFTDSRFMPYFSFMNGINIINETFGFDVEVDSTGNESFHFENTGDETLVRYAWQVGVGIMVNIISNLNVDLAVMYNSHFYHTESMNTGFEYGFGLVWSLNK
jgi:opacity protein-like surface antigen